MKGAKARLTLVNEINSSCLDGLEDYSYIWLIFIFHIGLNDYNNLKTKIAPPKLEGKKKGVFATRSPHRYNPIGLSLAKLEKIEGKTIHLSGADLIHGTPIIDIKPYHYLDSLDQQELETQAVYPEWLLESKERGRLEVKFCERSEEELRDIVDGGRLDFYSSYDEIAKVITEVFELNPHSVHTLNKHGEGIYAIALDNLNIIYTMNKQKTQLNIVKVMLTANKASVGFIPGDKKQMAPSEKLRTREWLEKMNEIMDFRGFKDPEFSDSEEEKEEEKKSSEKEREYNEQD